MLDCRTGPDSTISGPTIDSREPRQATVPNRLNRSPKSIEASVIKCNSKHKHKHKPGHRGAEGTGFHIYIWKAQTTIASFLRFLLFFR